MTSEQTEQDLQVANAWLRAFADMTSSLFCVFRVEPDGAVVAEWASDSFVRITGYTVDECRALPSWLDLIVEAERPIAMDRFRGLLEGNETSHQTRLLRKQGDVRVLRVSARALWTEDRTRVAALAIAARDVTDEERTKTELYEATTLNEEILAGANEGILVIDREYRYRFWNPRMERLTGVPKERVLGRTPWEMFPFLRGTGLDELLERVFSGQHVTSPDFPYEVPTTKQSGWAVQKMAPLRDPSGHVTAAIVLVEDITDRKSNEEEREKLWTQLVHAQKMEAIGRLAGGVAHDFNNLLGVILALSESAQSRMHREDPLWEVFNEVRQAGERAAVLTRQLLAFGRKQPLRTVPVDLSALVRGIETMLQRVLGARIELVTALAPDLGTALADPGQLEAAILNLVINARDSMPTGGRITIKTANVDSRVIVEITDTGSGMDETTRARCFEPFFTTKELGKGTGLGLSTTYGIVQQSGGDIEVESELGKGTTFKISLPRMNSKEPEVAAPHRATVLLVDDEPQILAVARTILEREGYEVFTAPSGAEALRISRDHVGTIDLVVTDVGMPQMSGQVLVEQLKRERPSIRVIFISGYPSGEKLEPGTAFVAKPFTSAALLDRVREVLAVA